MPASRISEEQTVEKWTTLRYAPSSPLLHSPTDAAQACLEHKYLTVDSVRSQSDFGWGAHFLLVQMTHRGRINLTTEVNKWNKMQ